MVVITELPTYITIAALAAFRIAELLVIDDGPFELFSIMRGWSLSTNPLLSNTGKAMQCVHCAGLWISATFAILYLFHNIYVDVFLLIFAIAGVQSLLANLLGRHRSH